MQVFNYGEIICMYVFPFNAFSGICIYFHIILLDKFSLVLDVTLR